MIMNSGGNIDEKRNVDGPLLVCHVCSGHRADDVRVFQRECLSLKSNGYKVALVAVSNEKKEYSVDGIRIVPLSPPIGGLMEKVWRRKWVASKAVALEPDLFHVHEPELLAPVLKGSRGKPVIFDVHESYMDLLEERESVPLPLRRVLAQLWDRSERKLIPQTAAVIAVTHPIAERYLSMNARVEVIANYPPFSSLIVDTPKRIRNGYTIVYVGCIRPDRGLLEVIKAMGILKQKGIDVTLRFAGPIYPSGFLEQLKSEASRQGISNMLDYAGIITRDEVMPFQADADVGVITYLPVRNSVKGLPNKLIEFMSLGIPVVFSDFPIYSEVAGDSGSGLPVNPENPTAIAHAIQRILTDKSLSNKLGEAGKIAFRERFNWDREEEKLLNLYKEILTPLIGKLS